MAETNVIPFPIGELQIRLPKCLRAQVEQGVLIPIEEGVKEKDVPAVGVQRARKSILSGHGIFKLLFRPICRSTLAIHVTLFATVSQLFPYSSRSLAIVPNVSRRLMIFSLLSPYAFLFVSYLSYADYDYLISPFHSHCYPFLALYVFLSCFLLCSFLRSH